MKYLSIYTPDPKSAGLPPDKDHMSKMGKLIDESIKAGTLVSTGALFPASKGGAVLRRSAGEISVVDGPFTETKEMIAGWAVIEAKTRDEAVEMVQKFLSIAGDGECLLRQMMDPGPAPSGI